MFKLAHISDVHLRPLPPVRFHHLISKRITGYLNWKLNRKRAITDNYLNALLSEMVGKTPDHTVVTGDLINLSLEAEFDQARDFLQSLGKPEDVSALCGNHDAYVPGALTKAIAKWRPWLSGDQGLLESASDYPVMRRRGTTAIILCNSAEATLPFFATGYFRKPQADRLSALLDSTRGLFRIVCIHHPPVKNATPGYKRLIGQSLFEECIKNHGAELILHGHTHLATTHKLPSPGWETPVICVPAAGNGHGGHRPAGRFNLYSIRRSSDHWQISMQGFQCKRTLEAGELVEERDFRVPAS